MRVQLCNYCLANSHRNKIPSQRQGERGRWRKEEDKKKTVKSCVQASASVRVCMSYTVVCCLKTVVPSDEPNLLPPCQTVVGHFRYALRLYHYTIYPLFIWDVFLSLKWISCCCGDENIRNSRIAPRLMSGSLTVFLRSPFLSISQSLHHSD